MKTDFKSSFLNDIKKIRNKALLTAIRQAILSVENAATLQDIPDLKKLKGNNKGNFYRIRISNHRIGVAIDNGTVIFVTVEHRKDIYKYFP